MFREGREAGNVNCGDGTLPSFRTEVYQRLGDLVAIRGACVLFGRRRSGIAASPLEKRRTEFAPKADKLNLSQRRFLLPLVVSLRSERSLGGRSGPPHFSIRTPRPENSDGGHHRCRHGTSKHGTDELDFGAYKMVLRDLFARVVTGFLRAHSSSAGDVELLPPRLVHSTR